MENSRVSLRMCENCKGIEFIVIYIVLEMMVCYEHIQFSSMFVFSKEVL